MAKHPAITLVYLGAHRTDRLDLGPAPEFAVLGQQHTAVHGHDEPAVRLETALVAAPKPGKTVWVLPESAAAQILDMPTGVVEGLEREQLADALSFESETLTAIPSNDSAIAGIPLKNSGGVLSEFRRFWITQLHASLRSNFEGAVQRAGARLAGVVHPGGLPRAHWDMPGAPFEEWRRVEVWDQLTFSLHGTAADNVETKILRSSPGSEAWTAGLPIQGPVSWLGPSAFGGHDVPHGPDGLPLNLEHVEFPLEDVPVAWLRAWAEELTSKNRSVPVVEPVSNVSPNRKFFVIGGVAAGLALALVLGHGAWLSLTATAARERADEQARIRLALAPPDNSAKEVADLSAQTAKVQAQLQELDARGAPLALERERIEKHLNETVTLQSKLDSLRAVHRPALSELLSAITEYERDGNAADMVIKDVRQDGSGDLKLTGLCRTSSNADGFASRLDARLSKFGWKIGAAQKALRDDRLAFDFTVVLTPAVLLDYLPASAPPQKAVTLNAAPSTAARNGNEERSR